MAASMGMYRGGEMDDSGGRTATSGSAKPEAVAPQATPTGTHMPPQLGDPLALTMPIEEGLMARFAALGIQEGRRPLDVKAGSVLRDDDVSFNAAKRRIEQTLSSAPQCGVVELPSRPLSGGVISRLWNQTILSKWWRDVYPVASYDVYQRFENKGATKLFRVTVSSKLLSSGVTVETNQYASGGERARQAAEEMRERLAGRDVTTEDSRRKAVVSREISAEKADQTTASSKGKSLVGILEDRELMLSREAERLGLPRNVSTKDISSLKALAAEMKSDVLRLVSDIEGGSNSLSKRSDGRTVVSTKSYDLGCAPLSSDFWGSYLQKGRTVSEVYQTTAFCGAFGSVLAAAVSVASMSMTPFTFALATSCLGALGCALGSASHTRRLHRLFESQGPGSLGEAVQPLKDAGLKYKASIAQRDLKLTILK